MLISNCNCDFGGNYFIPKMDSICDTGEEGSEFGNQKSKKKKGRFEVMLEQEIEKARKEK